MLSLSRYFYCSNSRVMNYQLHCLFISYGMVVTTEIKGVMLTVPHTTHSATGKLLLFSHVTFTRQTINIISVLMTPNNVIFKWNAFCLSRVLWIYEYFSPISYNNVTNIICIFTVFLNTFKHPFLGDFRLLFEHIWMHF